LGLQPAGQGPAAKSDAAQQEMEVGCVASTLRAGAGSHRTGAQALSSGSSAYGDDNRRCDARRSN
jgi:hypothetical protein